LFRRQFEIRCQVDAIQYHVVEMGSQLVGSVMIAETLFGSQTYPTPRGSVSYWVDSALRGRGIATPALALAIATYGRFPLERAVHVGNQASIGVLRGNGFTREEVVESYQGIHAQSLIYRRYR
jgi:ribosomal-protein-alanine N-acetyltransferase